MKPQEESFLASLVATAVLVGMSTSASAGISVQNWQLNLNSLSGLPGYSNVAGVLDSSINNLSFNGESYVTNTQALNSNGNPITGVYNSVDTGIFDITQKNGGVPLNLGGGQLTAYFTGTDTTTITGPNGGFLHSTADNFRSFTIRLWCTGQVPRITTVRRPAPRLPPLPLPIRTIPAPVVVLSMPMEPRRPTVR